MSQKNQNKNKTKTKQKTPQTKKSQHSGHILAPGYTRLRHKTDILALNHLRMIRTHVKLLPNREHQ